MQTRISPEILDKVFEPLFTTKQVGAGSDLGLSAVRGFARQSSDAVFIESLVGRGTCVTLYLSRTAEAITRITSQIEETVEGEENAVVVEDDPEIRPVIVQLVNNKWLFSDDSAARDQGHKIPPREAMRLGNSPAPRHIVAIIRT